MDIFTLLFMSAFIGLGMSIIMFSVHRTFKCEVHGLRHWAWGQLAMLLAVPFLAVRGSVTELIVVPWYNGALLLGLGLSLLGTQVFYGQRANWRLFLCVWSSALLGLLWWLVVSPSFAARVAVFSAAEVWIHLMQIRLVRRYGERHFSSYFFMALLLVQTALTLVRGCSALLLGDASADLLKGTALATGYLATSNLLVMLLSVAFLVLASRQMQLVLERRAMQDPLTGVLNRRGCAEYYERLQMHRRQMDTPLAVLAMDLDHFKSVNDEYGHAMGDKVLVHVAAQVRQMLREFDQVARFGGEEFVVLLPATSMQEAQSVARRIQSALRDVASDLPRCTLSIGIASQSNAAEDFDSLLGRADAAMYRAKTGGRDRIELAAGMDVTDRDLLMANATRLPNRGI